MAVWKSSTVIILFQCYIKMILVNPRYRAPEIEGGGGVSLERNPTVIILFQCYIKMILVNLRIQLGSRSSKGRAA